MNIIQHVYDKENDITKSFDIKYSSLQNVLYFIKYYKFNIIRISLCYVYFSYLISKEKEYSKLDITQCSDYERYKKTYKLIYRI